MVLGLPKRKTWIAAFPIVAALIAVACVVSSDTRAYRASKDSLRGANVFSPLKAHLLDGSVVLYERGANISNQHVTGSGMRYDAVRSSGKSYFAPLPLDSVVGFEVVERRVNPGRTLIYAPLSGAVSTALGVIAAVAIFGSCPTIYGDSAGVETLQAESFSYSIAPLLAKRDVDRMTLQPGPDGVIRLHIRNEALETHRLDHIEVLEVRHGGDEIAVPSPRGGAIAIGDWMPARVHDRGGQDVTRPVRDHDALFFSGSDSALDRAIAGGPTEDQLIITVAKRAAGDSVGLLLRARSSLLTTSVLYDHLLGRQGPLALDWLGRDLGRITTLARLGQWYGSNFGMRVEVESATGWTPVIRLMDFGPTAWRTVGLALPAVTTRDDSVRIRLTFPVDGFRIDQVAIGHRVRRTAQRRVPVARVIDRGGAMRADMLAMLASADGRDVETSPGQQFTVELDAGVAAGTRRTFFFAGQGYYTEWIRPSWMKHGDAAPFAGKPETMRMLLRDWRGGRDSLEAFFFRRRVPVL
jgi:hypothetical protein